MSGDSPVEEYLDQLLLAAPGAPRQVRALLAEAESHLWDATAEGVARGLPQAEAERQAVARFGPVRTVADAEARRQSVPLWTLLRQIATSAIHLGSLAAVAVGVSGVLLWIFATIGGSTFVVNISHHTYLSPSDCARWLSGAPAHQTCYQAALGDWRFDEVAFRLAAGVLGLIGLGVYLWVRRWRGFGDLPGNVVDTIAATGFVAGGLFLAGLGADWLIQGKNGAGQWLSAAPVALALGIYFGMRLQSALRQPAMPRLMVPAAVI